MPLAERLSKDAACSLRRVEGRLSRVDPPPSTLRQWTGGLHTAARHRAVCGAACARAFAGCTHSREFAGSGLAGWASPDGPFHMAAARRWAQGGRWWRGPRTTPPSP
jgi:hypothetical protein